MVVAAGGGDRAACGTHTGGPGTGYRRWRYRRDFAGLVPDQWQRTGSRSDGAQFSVESFITPHYDSYPAILVRLSRIDLDEMTELVTETWRLCAPKRMLAAYDAEHPPAH